MTTTDSTLFSTERFLKAWLSVEHHEYTRAARLISLSLGRNANLSGIARSLDDGSSVAEFAPHGLFASPSPGALDGGDIRRDLQKHLHDHGLSGFTWHVRFDHHRLISVLNQTGLPATSYETHVLPLDKSYDEIFAGYSATRRNQIRKCFRRGVSIRAARSDDDIAEYCRVHEDLETTKDFRTRYPGGLIHALVQLQETTLLLAELEGQVIAGALFFVDGNSFLYWHGAANRAYSEYFPMPALMDAAVQQASQAGLSSFNFGGSPSESLRFFKESFGAQVRHNWSFSVRRKPPLRTRIFHRALRELSRLSR